MVFSLRVPILVLIIIISLFIMFQNVSKFRGSNLISVVEVLDFSVGLTFIHYALIFRSLLLYAELNLL